MICFFINEVNGLLKGKIERIVLFKGDIETTGYFSMQMEKTFQKAGYQTYFFDYQHVA